MDIFWGCYGPNISKGSSVEDVITLKDISVVVSYAIGIEEHENWDGKLPSRLFK
ncbi:MAG: hypothetical protein GX974_09820 [Clostridiales bacterium]|nr:hypothetical protein [Clostridiales bacterium]